MKIEVTQEMIDFGKKCSAGFCPVALALKANGIRCAVDSRHIITFDDPVRRLRTTPEIARFVIHYDVHGSENAYPFSFDFDQLEEDE